MTATLDARDDATTWLVRTEGQQQGQQQGQVHDEAALLPGTEGADFGASPADKASGPSLLVLPGPGERIVLTQVDTDHINPPEDGRFHLALPELRYPGESRVERTRVTTSLRRREDGTLVFARFTSEMKRGIPRRRVRGPQNPPRIGDLVPAPVEPEAFKTWCRWQTTSLSVVAVQPDGTWRGTLMTRTPRGGKIWSGCRLFLEDVSPESASASQRRAASPDAFTRDGLIEIALGYVNPPRSRNEIFPLAEHYLSTTGLTSRGGDPLQLLGHRSFRSRFQGASTAAELTRNIFGVRSMRRDLVKAVAQTDLAALQHAWQFRGLVPVDWIVTYLRAHPAPSTEAALSDQSAPPADPAERRRQDRRASARAERLRDHHDLYRYLRSLDQRTLKRLLNADEGTLTQARWVVRDLARMPASRDITRVDSWRELHDRTADHMRRLGPTGKKRKPRTIELAPAFGALNTVLEPGSSDEPSLRIELATTETRLWEWGDQMRHCIASYCDDMIDGRGLYGGVYAIDPATGGDGGSGESSENLIGNFEIKLGYRHLPAAGPCDKTGTPVLTAERYLQPELTQLLGHHNSRLPVEVRDRVVAHLAAHNITVERYWGDERRLPG